MNIDKLFAGQSGLFLIICLVIILVLIGALIYILKLYFEERQATDEAEKKVVAKTRETEGWKREYSNLDRSYRVLLEKLKQSDRQNVFPTTHGNRFNHIEEGYEKYTREREEKDKVKEIRNDDGTVKNEIDFSLSYDEPVVVTFSPKYDFLEAAIGGKFRKLLPSDEKCFFRTWEENGIRKFEFHGNVEKALANINAIFDDVCEIEGKQNGATQIDNIAPGILNSQLKVETPAKIKLS